MAIDYSGLMGLLSGGQRDVNNTSLALARIREQQKAELEDRIAQQQLEPPTMSAFGSQGANAPQIANPNLGKESYYNSLLGSLKSDMAEDPDMGEVAQATTAGNLAANRAAAMQGFGSPQEMAAYPRAQAAKAAQSTQALQAAQAAEASGRAHQAEAVGKEYGQLGEAALIAAKAKETQARGYLPQGMASGLVKQHADLLKQYRALTVPQGGISRLMSIFDPGRAQRAASTLQDLNNVRAQLHQPPLTGTETNIPDVTAPGMDMGAPSTGGDVPPPELTGLQPGEVFDAPDGSVWGKRADGSAVRIR